MYKLSGAPDMKSVSIKAMPLQYTVDPATPPVALQLLVCSCSLNSESDSKATTRM